MSVITDNGMTVEIIENGTPVFVPADISGSSPNFASIQVDDLTYGQAVIGGGTGSLTTRSILGSGSLITNGSVGIQLTGSLYGSSSYSITASYCDVIPTGPIESNNAQDALMELHVKKLSNVLEITYSELSESIVNSSLIIGQSYLITDYQTVQDIPGTSDVNTGPIEPLFVTAISANELAPIAYSQLYPGDIIYYHIGTDETNFPGATKGYISRRIDTIQNNDIGTDWRHCKYRRYMVNHQIYWDNTETYSIGNAVKRMTGSVAQQDEIYISIQNDNLNHAVTDTDYWRLFEWKNGDYAGVSPIEWYIVDNEFTILIQTEEENYEDKLLFTYDSSISDNIILTYKLMNVTVGTNFYFNSIGNGFGSNSISNNFNSNSIGNNFNSNSIGNNFNSNSIGNNFYSNSIDNSFYFNSIDNSFYFNSIGNYFSFNSISNNFNSNSIGNNFNSNSIGNSFYSNSIDNNFKYNTALEGIGNNDFSSATHVYASYNTTISNRVDGSVRLTYINDSDELVIVNATS